MVGEGQLKFCMIVQTILALYRDDEDQALNLHDRACGYILRSGSAKSSSTTESSVVVSWVTSISTDAGTYWCVLLSTRG